MSRLITSKDEITPPSSILLLGILMILMSLIACQRKTNIPNYSSSKKSFQQLVNQAKSSDKTLTIGEAFDLKGKEINIGELNLRFVAEGFLSNGTIVGQGSTHQSDKRQCYKNIKIKGSWKVDKGYMEWFVGKKQQDAYANYQALCNLVTMGTVVQLSSIYPIATRSAEDTYRTLKPIKIEGENPETAGLILETRHANVFKGFFRSAKGNSISLKNISLKTRDFINGIYSNAECDYLLASCYYQKDINAEACPQIEYIEVEGCRIYGALSIAIYGAHSDNQSLKQFGNENRVDTVNITNNYFNYCNAPFGFANMGFNQVNIENNEVQNISSAFISFSASGIPDTYKEAVFANRNDIRMIGNYFHNDHPIQVPSDRAMTTMVVKGGDGTLLFQDNRLENMTTPSRDADAHYLYFTCTPKGKASIIGNTIKNVVARGSRKYPATLVKQRAAANLLMKDNHFEISKQALVDIGVLSSINDEVSQLTGKDFYIDFIQIGTSDSLIRDYEIRNNTFITPMVNKSSLIHDIANFIFEDNKLDIGYFGKGGFQTSVSKDGVLFLGRYRLDGIPNKKAGDFISRNNQIRIDSCAFPVLFFYHYTNGVQTGNAQQIDRRFNYKNTILKDQIAINYTDVVYNLFDTEVQSIETIVKGKNSSVSIADIANVNHRRPNTRKLSTNTRLQSFLNCDTEPLFAISPNSFQKVTADENKSSVITLLKFGTNHLLYNLKENLPLLVQIQVTYLNRQGAKKKTNTYDIIFDDKYRSLVHLGKRGTLKTYDPNTDMGKREWIGGKKELSDFDLVLLHGEHNKRVLSELRIENADQIQSFEIQLRCSQVSGKYQSTSQFLNIVKQSSFE